MSVEFTQELTIPSQGLLNPEIPDGVLTQRCMMVKDQKILSGSDQSSGNALHRLIQATITSPENFDVSKLTVTDTLYILFKLRILSYGKDYKFKAKCPECGQKIEVSMDLSELPVDLLEADYTEKLIAKLPHTGDTVYTKLLTNKESEEINKEIKRRKKRNNSSNESSYALRIARSIEKIELATPTEDGRTEITSAFEIERYIEALTDLDASAILAARDSVQYGINPIVEYMCPECREYIDVNVQFSGEFFRPSFS